MYLLTLSSVDFHPAVSSQSWPSSFRQVSLNPRVDVQLSPRAMLCKKHTPYRLSFPPIAPPHTFLLSAQQLTQPPPTDRPIPTQTQALIILGFQVATLSSLKTPFSPRSHPLAGSEGPKIRVTALIPILILRPPSSTQF